MNVCILQDMNAHDRSDDMIDYFNTIKTIHIIVFKIL